MDGRKTIYELSTRTEGQEAEDGSSGRGMVGAWVEMSNDIKELKANMQEHKDRRAAGPGEELEAEAQSQSGALTALVNEITILKNCVREMKTQIDVGEFEPVANRDNTMDQTIRGTAGEGEEEVEPGPTTSENPWSEVVKRKKKARTAFPPLPLRRDGNRNMTEGIPSPNFRATKYLHYPYQCEGSRE